MALTQSMAEAARNAAIHSVVDARLSGINSRLASLENNHRTVTPSPNTFGDNELTQVKDSLEILGERVSSLESDGPRNGGFTGNLTIKLELPDKIEHTLEGLFHRDFPKLLRIVQVSQIAGKHLFMHGAAGSGKTTLASQICKALTRKSTPDKLGIPFHPWSFSPDSRTHELSGFLDANLRMAETAFYKAFKYGGGYFADEMGKPDSAGVLTWLHSALSNGWVTFPNGETVFAHEDFYFMGADNTCLRGASRVYNSSSQQDGAIIDRLAFFESRYDESMELAMIGNSPEAVSWHRRVLSLRGSIQRQWFDLGQEPPMLVTPRATKAGFAFLQAGFSQSEVEDMVVWSGIDRATRLKVLAGAR